MRLAFGEWLGPEFVASLRDAMPGDVCEAQARELPPPELPLARRFLLRVKLGEYRRDAILCACIEARAIRRSV
jgi:hypothetical protein